jgi:hypothetical protein
VNRYVTALFTSIIGVSPALLPGCGSSTNAPAPQSAPAIAAKPDVIITVDGVQHACVVALYSEPYGNNIPCTDVIPFLRDELKVPSGAVYDLRTIATVDQAEVLKVRADLKDAGYRFIGGHSTVPTQSGR